jgi:arginyl-tRNA synthetase
VDQLYVQAAQDYEQNQEIASKIKQLVIDWENHHKQTRALWEKVMDYSHQGQALTLKRLGNQWDHVWHEHEHYELGKEFVQKGLEQGIFRQLEDGAVLTDLKDYDLPDTILQKSDGTSLYITQDIGLTYLKKQKHHADKMFWVVGPEQNLALRQMFAVCDQLGIADYNTLNHLSYGYMSLKNQGKMSSRAGNVIYIDDLIDEAKCRVQDKMHKEGLSEREIDQLSEQVALGAVKYSILRVGRQTDMAFDFETALSLNGNSGPYLQYTHARADSVLRKANAGTAKNDTTAVEKEQIWLGLELQAEEQDLLRYIYRWPEVIKEAGLNYEPSALATFLYQLAQKYNSFYNKYQILVNNNEIRSFRLTLTQAVKQVLAESLSLLGISAPERM